MCMKNKELHEYADLFKWFMVLAVNIVVEADRNDRCLEEASKYVHIFQKNFLNQLPADRT